MPPHPHPRQHLPWMAPGHGRNALRQILVFFRQSCKTQPGRSAGMSKQTTDMIKTPRPHGNIPDIRPPERWGGTSKAPSPGVGRRPKPSEERHGRQVPAAWPGVLKGLNFCCFQPVLQKTQLSPGDPAWCLGGCVYSGTKTQIELSTARRPSRPAKALWACRGQQICVFPIQERVSLMVTSCEPLPYPTLRSEKRNMV